MTPTQQRDLILYDKLRGVREHTHTIEGGCTVGDCLKCSKSMVRIASDETPCPIPDPFPNKDGSIASDPEIAWEIQQWLAKQGNDTKMIYVTELYRNWNEFMMPMELFSYSVLELKPEQKITAFTNMFKESE